MHTKATLPPFPGWGEIPPLDLQLNGTRPRPDATTQRVLVDFATRQPPLRQWLEHRAAAYHVAAPTWPRDVVIFAAARDAAMYQLRRPVLQIVELLAILDTGARSFPPR